MLVIKRRDWDVLDDIAIKGKKPWFMPKTALILTVFCVLISGVFHFPILTGIIIGIQAFWKPISIGVIFYFFWSFPRQFLTIIFALILWVIVGPGFASLWFWGVLNIINFNSIHLLIRIILTIIWTFGPIAIGTKIIRNFGILKITKIILIRNIKLIITKNGIVN